MLVRIDGADSTHALLDWLTDQRLAHSIGFGLPATTSELVAKIPDHVWQPACDSDGHARDGAWVADSPTC